VGRVAEVQGLLARGHDLERERRPGFRGGESRDLAAGDIVEGGEADVFGLVEADGLGDEALDVVLDAERAAAVLAEGGVRRLTQRFPARSSGALVRGRSSGGLSEGEKHSCAGAKGRREEMTHREKETSDMSSDVSATATGTMTCGRQTVFTINLHPGAARSDTSPG